MSRPESLASRGRKTSLRDRRTSASGRKTNLALLVTLSLALITGGASFLLGSSSTAWLVTVHGVLGFVVLVLARPKSPVVQRGLSRRWPNRFASIALATVVTGALITGLVHTLNVWEPFGVWSPIGLHVIFAIAAVPLVALHVVTRPQRIRPVDLSRRTWLQVLGVAGIALGLRTGFDRWIAADRRFTGSHEVGSGEPGQMPVVQWFNDTPPRIDPNDWVLRLRGSVQRDVDYQELRRHTLSMEATLDCTNGWYSTQTWTGANLADLLGPDISGRSLQVRSATGYSRRFPLSDVHKMMLAYELGGKPLSRGHGAPARLVAPGRRGLWWVKWVTEVRTSDRPWWLQSPISFT